MINTNRLNIYSRFFSEKKSFNVLTRNFGHSLLEKIKQNLGIEGLEPSRLIINGFSFFNKVLLFPLKSSISEGNFRKKSEKKSYAFFLHFFFLTIIKFF